MPNYHVTYLIISHTEEDTHYVSLWSVNTTHFYPGVTWLEVRPDYEVFWPILFSFSSSCCTDVHIEVTTALFQVLMYL